MYYVYILKRHNVGDGSIYSKRHVPWKVESYFAFSSRSTAEDFERYLKGGSGRAFMRKHLLSNQFKEALAKFNNGRKPDEASAE
jgi:predicted GIY-YIG superfamily endonuclease